MRLIRKRKLYYITESIEGSVFYWTGYYGGIIKDSALAKRWTEHESELILQFYRAVVKRVLIKEDNET